MYSGRIVYFIFSRYTKFIEFLYVLGAVSLHGMLDIPEEMAEYVNDCRMLLVEAGSNGLLFQNADNRDLFRLLEIVLDGSMTRDEMKRKAIQYSEEHNTGKSVVMTVAGATSSRIDYKSFEKGDGRMCTLFEEIAKESEDIGRAEGGAEGRAEEIHQCVQVAFQRSIGKNLYYRFLKISEFLPMAEKVFLNTQDPLHS